MKMTVFLAACSVALLAGCGASDKPPPYANVSGTVTFNGKPLDKGTITFSTDGRPPSVMDIADGKYSGQAMAGSNKVSISAKKPGQASSVPNSSYDEQMKAYAKNGPPGSSGPTQSTAFESGIEMIPADWNTSSKQMRVVETGTANKLDFDIKGK